MTDTLKPLTDLINDKYAGMQVYRTLFDHFNEAMVITGGQGSFIDVNKKFLDGIKYTKEFLLNVAFIELVHPEDREKTLEMYSGNLKGQAAENFQNRYRCGDGQYRLFTWQAITLLPDNIYGKAIIVDIQ